MRLSIECVAISVFAHCTAMELPTKTALIGLSTIGLKVSRRQLPHNLKMAIPFKKSTSKVQ